MTKEELLREFLSDDLVEAKGYMTKAQVEQLKFSDPSESKLINVFKTAIQGKASSESLDQVTRKLNQLLNK
jgi:hypothetical protein